MEALLLLTMTRRSVCVCVQLLLHAADLSNLCKRWDIHVQWSHAILAEFFAQARSKTLDFKTSFKPVFTPS